MVKEKTSLYLLSILGIVAVVGIVILLMNTSTIDLTGQARKAGAVCGDGTCAANEARATTT